MDNGWNHRSRFIGNNLFLGTIGFLTCENIKKLVWYITFKVATNTLKNALTWMEDLLDVKPMEKR